MPRYWRYPPRRRVDESDGHFAKDQPNGWTSLQLIKSHIRADCGLDVKRAALNLGAGFDTNRDPLNSAVPTRDTCILNLRARNSWLGIKCRNFGSCVRVMSDVISRGHSIKIGVKLSEWY